MKALLITFLLVLGSVAQAAEPAIPEISCADFFQQVNDLSGSPGIADKFDDIKEIEIPSVDVIESVEGYHGGQRLKVRKKDGHRWGSSNTTTGFDPQGDPRWFIEVLGPKAAAFFGFEMIDDSHMMVPDSTEFSNALEKVNAELKRQGFNAVPLTFYATGNNENTKAGEYVKRFVTDYGIPIAASGNHLFHDLSFHTAAIVLPREILEFKAAVMQFHREFFAHYREVNKDASEDIRKAINFYELLINLESTQDVDNMTGLTGPLFLDYLKRKEIPEEDRSEHHDLPEIYMVRMVFYAYPADQPPAGYLEEFLQQPRVVDQNRVQRLYAHWKNLSPEVVGKAMKEFAKTWRSEQFPGFRADVPAHPTMELFEKFVEELCVKMTARRKLIIEATQRLAD